MKRIKLAAVTVMALFLLLTVGATNASADTFDFTSCHATTGCATPGTSYGTITLTSSGGVTTVDVVLTGGSYFIETGAGAMELFLFNALAGTTVSNLQATYNGSDVTSNLGGLTYVYHSTAVQADGTGTFTGSIECTVQANCNGSSINNVQKVNDLHFTTNETLAQLETVNNGGNFFVADIAIFGNGANTGDVDVSPTPTVPDGGMTLMLLGGALVGLEGLRRRVRA